MQRQVKEIWTSQAKSEENTEEIRRRVQMSSPIHPSFTVILPFIHLVQHLWKHARDYYNDSLHVLAGKKNAEADKRKPGQSNYAAVRQPICRQTQVGQRRLLLQKRCKDSIDCTVLQLQLHLKWS